MREPMHVDPALNFLQLS